jgi:DNA-binding response OmpR family regulator
VPNVLVVDDDDAWRLTLAQVLGDEGIGVTGCAQGEAAVTAVQTHHPDVVVLDVQLPGQSGLDVLRSLRREWPALPVIITTAFGGEEIERAARRAGADAYIGKPFRLERLLAVLRRTFRERDRSETFEAP